MVLSKHVPSTPSALSLRMKVEDQTGEKVTQHPERVRERLEGVSACRVHAVFISYKADGRYGIHSNINEL